MKEENFWRNLSKKAIIYLINFYRKYISPYKKPSCRFYPSCSEFAIEAVSKHGVLRGAAYSFFRILRCNRFFKGGYDPVP